MLQAERAPYCGCMKRVGVPARKSPALDPYRPPCPSNRSRRRSARIGWRASALHCIEQPACLTMLDQESGCVGMPKFTQSVSRSNPASLMPCEIGREEIFEERNRRNLSGVDALFDAASRAMFPRLYHVHAARGSRTLLKAITSRRAIKSRARAADVRKPQYSVRWQLTLECQIPHVFFGSTQFGIDGLLNALALIRRH